MVWGVVVIQISQNMTRDKGTLVASLLQVLVVTNGKLGSSSVLVLPLVILVLVRLRHLLLLALVLPLRCG